jgi:hypothetical protein
MTWGNYFDSNRTFTVILYINAVLWIPKDLAVPINSPYDNFAFYDELQKSND